MQTLKPSSENHRNTYEVKQLEKTPTPERGRGNDWYRYVIEGARSRIVGYTHGTYQQVTQNVQGFVVNMNARTEGRSIYPWTPRKSW